MSGSFPGRTRNIDTDTEQDLGLQQSSTTVARGARIAGTGNYKGATRVSRQTEGQTDYSADYTDVARG